LRPSFEHQDVGIYQAISYQPQFGHHVSLMITHADEQSFPDGTTFDCTDRNTMPMTNFEPLYMPIPIDDGEGKYHTEMNLPSIVMWLRSTTMWMSR
jgi:hypothetical protein